MPIERLFAQRKLLAALVMIAGLATAVCTLGIGVAMQRAVERQSACTSDELRGAMVPLELGKPPALGDSSHADCYLAGLTAALDADDVFLVSYSLLNLALFLFLTAAGRLRPALPWCLAGIVLSAVTLVGDGSENCALYGWIDQARRSLASGSPHFPLPPPSTLAIATTGKWAALALACLLCGVAYLFQRPRGFKLLVLPGVAGAGLTVLGLCQHEPRWLLCGMRGLAILWLGALLHSIVLCLQQPRTPPQPAAAKGASAQ